MLKDKNAEIFADQILRNQTFVGRVIGSTNGGRTAVLVDKNNDYFISKMKIVDQRLRPLIGQSSKHIDWMDSSQIGEKIMFCQFYDGRQLKSGWYWFMVKSVDFTNNCITVSLELVQKLTVPVRDNLFDFKDFKEIASRTYCFLKAQINHIPIGDTLNMKNIGFFVEKLTSFVKFACLLFIFLFSTFMQFVELLLNHAPSLMAGSAQCITAVTPIIREIIISLTKLVGGFYLLIGMIWRDLINPNKRPQHYGRRRNSTETYRRPILYLEDRKFIPADSDYPDF